MRHLILGHVPLEILQGVAAAAAAAVEVELTQNWLPALG
jgi:precorrin-4 methylase